MGEAGQLKLPQADDVAKIADLPLAIAEGANSPRAVSDRYRFNPRQAQYYLQAGEFLGLITKRRNRYVLSQIGHRYVALTPAQRKELLVRRMLSTPLVERILFELMVSPLHRLTRLQIGELMATRSRISGTTIARRTQSILSWLAWIAEETNVIKVGEEYVALSTFS
jgi:hypothetical protein